MDGCKRVIFFYYIYSSSVGSLYFKTHETFRKRHKKNVRQIVSKKLKNSYTIFDGVFLFFYKKYL